MKKLAGAVLVLAGAVLVGTSNVSAAILRGYAEPVFLYGLYPGVFLAIVGLIVLTVGFARDPQ